MFKKYVTLLLLFANIYGYDGINNDETPICPQAPSIKSINHNPLFNLSTLSLDNNNVNNNVNNNGEQVINPDALKAKHLNKKSLMCFLNDKNQN
jgi:hypothetical protein